MPRSIRQLKAKPAAASSEMPASPASIVTGDTHPSDARSMPISAQKAASMTILGLVSARYWAATWRQPGAGESRRVACMRSDLKTRAASAEV